MPAILDQFTYGWTTPALAFVFSFLGCLLGLKATARARLVSSGAERARWLILAAWAIGGTGIWAMHFVAMIGFGVNGSGIAFNLPLTIASWLTAVVVVGLGLFTVGYGKPSVLKVVVAGTLTGLGVAAMHYSGMDAMRMDGTVSYDHTLVEVSVGIAVVAATVALWFAVAIRRTFAVIIGAAIMAVAVCSMHYTGMAALRVSLNPTEAPIAGTDAIKLLVPIVVFVLVVVILLGYAMLNSPSERDVAELDAMNARISNTGKRPHDNVPRSSGFRIPTDSNF
jgi:NO-binding membrane sensor protein with MHYT domain